VAIGTHAIGTRAYGDGAVVLTGAYAGGPTTYTISVGGAITPSGALVKLIGKVLAGSVSSSGGLFVLGPGGLLLTGTITPAGGLSRRVGKSPSGALGPTGALSLIVTSSSDTTLRPGFIPIV
jgi:hypothetical protein